MAKIKPSARASLQRPSQHRHPAQAQANASVASVPVKRFNMLLPVSLHRRLKHQAVEEGRGMTAIVVDLIQAYLDGKAP